MITISTLNKAKQFTQSAFNFLKENQKATLNSFRDHIAKEFGYSQLNQAFNLEQEKKREEILSKYITFMDDERITLEVARFICYNQSEDTERKLAKDYFKEHLAGKENEVNFPVKNVEELLKRCNEILILHDENLWYSFEELCSILFKISMNEKRISYKYSNNKEDFFGNPELAMAFETHKCFFQDQPSKLSSFFDISEEDLTPEDGFYSLYLRFKDFNRGLIWTQTNVGSSVYHQSRKNTES